MLQELKKWIVPFILYYVFLSIVIIFPSIEIRGGNWHSRSIAEKVGIILIPWAAFLLQQAFRLFKKNK